MKQSFKPYISFVICGRNDDYAVNYLARLRSSLKVLIGFAERHKLACEVLITEWNPPQDRPQLKDVLDLGLTQNYSRVRIVEVPPEIHARFQNTRKLALFDHYARNVGIRRARGEFILATSSDILFSEELVKFLAQRTLEKSRYYRIDRFDIKTAPELQSTPDAAIRFAKKNVFEAYFRQRSFRRGLHQIGPLRKLYYNALNRWPTSVYKKQNRLPGQPLVCLEDGIGKYNGLHLFASGDFILASNEAWQKIHGFTETHENSANCDSYACYQFRAIGLKQTLLLPPCMIFHIDHPRGKMINAPGWPENCGKILRGELGPALNPPTWGLGTLELKETTLGNL